MALDSLARTHTCAKVRAALLFDQGVWTRKQACALAGRALEILGSARAREPYMAPGDTARVSTMRVTRQHWCQLLEMPGGPPAGRMDSLLYVVDFEIPDRPRYLGVFMRARGFTGSATFDAHPRGVWGSPTHLTQPTEGPDTIEAGEPCGM